MLTYIAIMLLAAPAYAQHVSTSGRCPYLGDCVLGDDNVKSITLKSAQGMFAVGEEFANQAVLTANSTATAVIKGADAAGNANTRFDTTGSGTIEVGSPDVTSVTIVTDGGSIVLDGTISVASDVVVAPTETATFGAPNAFFDTPANLNQYVGIPRLNVTQLGDGIADGTSTTELITPLAGTCAVITAGVDVDDSTLFITDAASYKYTGASTAADNDGFDCDVTGPTAGDSTDSIGFWFRSDTALTAGTLDVSLLDGASVEGGPINMPAITVVDEWQWIEIDLGSSCDSDCTGIDGWFMQVTTAGAATSEMDGTVLHIDSGAIWLDTAEATIGDVQVGGVISVSVAAVAAGSDNTTSELVEYTDYIVNYQTGADVLVFITKQDDNYGWTLEVLND
jgi:hypothetical protein